MKEYRRLEFPDVWKSLKTGAEYPYEQYVNHGYGGIKNGKMDLPKDEYPYTIIYKLNK